MKKFFYLFVAAIILVGVASCNNPKRAAKRAHKNCNCPTWD
ncbi:MAG: hypothetical protein ACEQSL_01295 [Sediminibacterium sp.]